MSPEKKKYNFEIEANMWIAGPYQGGELDENDPVSVWREEYKKKIPKDWAYDETAIANDLNRFRQQEYILSKELLNALVHHPSTAICIMAAEFFPLTVSQYNYVLSRSGEIDDMILGIIKKQQSKEFGFGKAKRVLATAARAYKMIR